MVGTWRQPAEQHPEQPFELAGVEVGGRAAAEEKGVDRLRRAKGGQFGGEGVEVAVDEVVVADGDGEVAVAAVVGAEGDVDVGGARPDPRRFVGHGYRVAGTHAVDIPTVGPPG